jgi:hypothetical protein
MVIKKEKKNNNKSRKETYHCSISPYCRFPWEILELLEYL